MYAIYAYTGVVWGVNVGIYGIHGVYGYTSPDFTAQHLTFQWKHPVRFRVAMAHNQCWCKVGWSIVVDI